MVGFGFETCVHMHRAVTESLKAGTVNNQATHFHAKFIKYVEVISKINPSR